MSGGTIVGSENLDIFMSSVILDLDFQVYISMIISFFKTLANISLMKIFIFDIFMMCKFDNQDSNLTKGYFFIYIYDNVRGYHCQLP